jgi:hypothetical protein
LPFRCIFQASVDDEQWKEEDGYRVLQCDFIFCVSVCIKSSFLVLPIVFLDMN